MTGMMDEERKTKAGCEGGAYHEAAHAVVYHRLGIPLKEVSIDHVFSVEGTFPLEACIMCHLAGVIMDEKLGRDCANRDWLDAYSKAGSLVGIENSAAVHRVVERLRNETKAIIEEPRNWAAIQAIARLLLRGQRFKGPEADQVVGNALRHAGDGSELN